jgi:hypothetical protein
MSFTTPRTNHAKLFELILEGMAGVLTAAIGMMHHTTADEDA